MTLHTHQISPTVVKTIQLKRETLKAGMTGVLKYTKCSKRPRTCLEKIVVHHHHYNIYGKCTNPVKWAEGKSIVSRIKQDWSYRASPLAISPRGFLPFLFFLCTIFHII